jgi:hypothetical protein
VTGPSSLGRRRRSATVVLGSALCTLLVLAQPALAANAPPETTVTSPAHGAAYLPQAEVAFVGTASDDVGVKQVKVAIQNPVTRLWWHANDSWGAIQWQTAALTRPGLRNTAWSWTWPGGPEGAFVLHAQARDGNGVVDASHATRRVVVSTAAETRYLTLAFGRTQWVTARQCVPMESTVTLGAVADDMTAMGIADDRSLTGTGNVVIDRAGEMDPACMTYGLMATWPQIADLRDVHGWTFVSAGDGYRDMTELTQQEQVDESCGSLDSLQAHGHTRGWGLFAYPNNRKSSTIQTSVVSTCFAYGRAYDYRFNELGEMMAPWFQRTTSVNGGACNVVGQPCYSLATTGAKYHYRTRESLASLMQPGRGEWSVVQMYRFVTGAHSSSTFDWDCTDSNPDLHWVSNSELYCYDDFLWALDQIPADVVVTDPATVAEAWGRGNPNP